MSSPADSTPSGQTLGTPLSPWLFLVRNVGRSGPLALVITLAVLLIAGIVSIMDSIPLSIKTVYGYSRYLTGVTSRGDMEYFPKLARHFDDAPVTVERKIVCRILSFNVKSIVGPWPFALYGFRSGDGTYMAAKIGLGKLQGRLPALGSPEAVISQPIAKNLGLRLGDSLLRPVDERNYSPFEVKVVGIYSGDLWIAFTSYEYLARNHFPPVDVLMVFAKNQSDQRILDGWTEDTLRGARAMTYTYPSLERDTYETFDILFKILDMVIGLLVLVIALMMCMLINIYLGQRNPEFGLLQAVGVTRGRLVRRAFAEVALVVALGWFLGVVLTYGLLSTVNALLMQPRAYALDPLDPRAYAYTLAVPLVITVAAAVTVWVRFRRFDPISVIERRLM